MECGERLKAKEKWAAEDEMVRWHQQLNGHEFEQTLGDSKEQGSLACYNTWGIIKRVGHGLVTEKQHWELSTIVYSLCCWAFAIRVIMNEDS